MTGSLRLALPVLATLAVGLLLGAEGSALAAAQWEARQVAVGKGQEGLMGVACPTASLCVAVGARGTVVTSTDPGGGAAAWRSETVARGAHAGTAAGQADRTSPGAFESVSCPTAGMCAAVSYAGDLYASGDPAGGAATWRATDLDGEGADTALRGVSCPAPELCVAVATGGTGETGGGKVVAIADPLAPAPSLVHTQLDESLDLQSVSCPFPGFCVAVASKGRVLVSANPAGGAWRELGTPGGPGDLEAVECPTVTLCLAGNARGNVLTSSDASSAAPSWRTVNTGPSVPITGISCPTVSRCAAVDNNGDVIVSRDPTGPSSAWSATNLIPFSPAGAQGPPFNAFFGVSCPSAGFCAAVGSRGAIFTSANPFELDAPRNPAQRGGPRRPRMKIVRGDHFAKQRWAKGKGSWVTFRLRPYGRAHGFVCRLDRRRFRPCKSPLRIYAKVGRHVLRARAIGSTGLRGPVTRHRFEILR